MTSGSDPPTTHQPLSGCRALVSGGGSGIGRAIAESLHDHGAAVTLLGRDRERLAAAAAPMGGGIAVCDVGDEAEVESTVALLGVIDILVNNAGVVATASLPRTELAAFERQIAVNLTGAFLLMRALVPAMVVRGFGRVVNVTSTAAHRGYPYAAGYCASKHGLLGLTRAAGLELARTGVTVNAVSPGYTETPLLEAAIRAAAAATRRTPAAVRASFLDDNPMGRFVQPEEVASAVTWLCAPQQAAITGQAITLAGGPNP